MIFLAIFNYRMVSVGVTGLDYAIRFCGDGANCPTSEITNLKAIDTSAFPATMNRMQSHNIAFSAETSTLVACGGVMVN
jgi:hypothetical protein